MLSSRELSIRVVVALRVGTVRHLKVLEDSFLCLLAHAFVTSLQIQSYLIAEQFISTVLFKNVNAK